MVDSFWGRVFVAVYESVHDFDLAQKVTDAMIHHDAQERVNALLRAIADTPSRNADFLCPTCGTINSRVVKILETYEGGGQRGAVVDIHAPCDGCGDPFLLDAEKTRLAKLWESGKITINQGRARMGLAPLSGTIYDQLYVTDKDGEPTKLEPAKKRYGIHNLNEVFGGDPKVREYQARESYEAWKRANPDPPAPPGLADKLFVVDRHGVSWVKLDSNSWSRFDPTTGAMIGEPISFSAIEQAEGAILLKKFGAEKS